MTPVARLQQISVIQTWTGKSARLGQKMTVRRVLPSADMEAIGPFVFFDHVGPMQSPRMNLGAHPHAGIEVVTYLIEGANEHRDSMGNRGSTYSGGAQWLTGGKGLLHAERIGVSDDGITPENFHAVQIWSRLLKSLEDCEPAYRAVLPTEIPEIQKDGTQLRLVAGTNHLFEEAGPVTLKVDALILYVRLAPAGGLDLPLSANGEFAVYVLSGAVRLGQDRALLHAGSIAALSSGTQLSLTALSAGTECLVIGGTHAERPLVYSGSFVFGSAEKARAAQRLFEEGGMGRMDGVPF